MGILKVVNSRVLALLSRLALFMWAWLELMGISQSSEFAGVASTVEAGFDDWGVACIHGDRRFLKVLSLRMMAPPSRLALNIGTWLEVAEVFKSSEFASVGSTVEVGFHYRGLALCNRGS